MTSYFSNLLTTTTSRYNSIRKALLSDESDGDTEDESHISRVLRAYYTEKGRAFPPWLPPDPKAPQPAAPAAYVSGRSQTPMSAGRGGGLSDLWDSGPQQQAPRQTPGSLRGGGGGGGRTLQGRGGIVDSYNQEPARPLPSQRAGSYQSSLSQSSSRFAADPSPPPSAGSGSTAQERLKARLWGSGRTTSPGPSASSGQSSPGFNDSRGGFQSNRSSGGDDRGYNSGGYESGNSSQRPPGRERVGLPSGPRGLPSGPRLR